MQRTVSARIIASASADTSLVFAVAAVRNAGYDTFDENLTLTVDGEAVEARELDDHHGGRLHALTVERPAKVVLDYSATVTGFAEPEPVHETDLVRYVRPSRYCESDRLLPTAYARFADVNGSALVEAVRNWVHDELSYVSGSSRPTDGSVDTLLARRGVCRDYAHLVVSLLRARDVPARLAAVYAPGLSPMDFHAVVEAYVDGRWVVVDATGLAPRQSLLRISTGRDASDTAFLSTVGGGLTLQELTVTAVSDGQIPADDHSGVVELH